MEFKASKHIGLMAVVIDEANEISETIRVDTLRMMSIVVNHHAKAMLFAFAWGGYDTLGKFHMDPNRPASHKSIQENVKCNKCSENPETEEHGANCEALIWNECACDENGNPVLDHGEAFVRKVMIDREKIHDVIAGAWPLKELELKHAGQCVYRKTVDKKQTNVEFPSNASKE